MKQVLGHKWVVIVTFCLATASVSHAGYSTYADLASFQAAAGPTALQNFNSYGADANLRGIELLPGVTADSNMSSLVAFPDVLFGYDSGTPDHRAIGDAYYDLTLAQPYRAIAFDVAFWNPAAPGPAIAEISFADATSASVNWYKTTGSEYDPVFFGMVADQPITRLRWHEGPEADGTGNEEVAIDNLRVGSVPEPAFAGVAGVWALLLLRRSRR